MHSFANRKTALFVGLLLLMIIIYRINHQAELRGKTTPVSHVMVACIGSVQWVITGAGDIIGGLFNPLIRAHRLDNENHKLKAEVERMRGQLAQLSEYKSENERLRGLLKLQDTTTFEQIPAEIIGRNPSNWFDTVLLNRGQYHGVKRDSIVVTDAGVVGRVYKVYNFTSIVFLLTDPQGAVGGLVQRTRQPGLVEGRHTHLLHLMFLPKDSDIKSGDLIVTSGLGGVFPAGLPIGRVVRVGMDPKIGSKAADILPAVDPTRIEQVVILNTGAPK